jgi:uncharacterized protein (UPF0262 family)
VAAELREILIDDATWSRGTPARKSEWRLAIREVLEEGRFNLPGDGPMEALLTVDPHHVRLEARAGGHGVAEALLPIEELRPHLSEYMNICLELSKLGVGSASPRLEALDIAKRLTHDEAAETVRRLCAPLGPDPGTARRLFTLLVTLLYDTTRLGPLAHAHPRRA